MTKTSNNLPPSISELTSTLGRKMRRHIVVSSLLLSLVLTTLLVIFQANERLSYLFQGLEGHYGQLLSGGDVLEVTRNLKSLQRSNAFSAAWIIDEQSKKVLTSVVGEGEVLQSYDVIKQLVADRAIVFIDLRPYIVKTISIRSVATRKNYIVECIAAIPLTPALFSLIVALAIFLILGEYFKLTFAGITDRLTKPLTHFVALLKEARSVDDEIINRTSEDDAYLEISELSAQLIAFQKRAARAESLVRNSERLAAIGETTSAIAHDIKGPLHTIKKIVVMPFSESRQRNMLAAIKDIDLLVQDLLEYSRPGIPAIGTDYVTSINQELKGLIDSINQIQSISKINGDSPIKFVTAYPSHDVCTAMPPLHFRRIKKNIIDNALTALSERQNKDIEPMLLVDVRVHGDETEINIRNNGPAIAADDTNSIFEPFKSTRIGKGGTGLGLAIVKKLVLDFSGSVAAANRAGFVVFSIRLPICQGVQNV